MSTGAAEVVLGLLRTGDLDVALPLSALREVVPCPADLGALPVVTPGLLGSMELRSTVLPVVDLLHLLGRHHDRRSSQVVVVVAHDGRLVGLLVDDVRGLAALDAASFDVLECPGTDLLFTRSFHHPEQGHVVSELDPAALLSLRGVPVVRERAVADPLDALDGVLRRGRALTVVRCGDVRIAVDVAHVSTTIPTPALSRSAVDGPLCLGMTPVAGQDVPVVDLLALLGLGSLVGSDLECGVVVESGEGRVVLGVTELVGLRDAAPSTVVPLPAVASPDAELVPEVVDLPDLGACLLLDGEHLRALPVVAALARTVTESGAAQAAGLLDARERPRAKGPAHLAYRAGVDVATPLDQVVEVLAHPEDLVRSASASGVLGFVVHRGKAVPVWCLTELLGRGTPEWTPASRLLLLEVDGASVAYAVSSLHAILPRVWDDEDAPRQRPVDGAADLTRLLRSAPLVELDTMDRLLPAVDLVALTRRLAAEPPAQAEKPSHTEPQSRAVPRARSGDDPAPLRVASSA